MEEITTSTVSAALAR
jgi:hypothetical protein